MFTSTCRSTSSLRYWIKAFGNSKVEKQTPLSRNVNRKSCAQTVRNGSGQMKSVFLVAFLSLLFPHPAIVYSPSLAECGDFHCHFQIQFRFWWRFALSLAISRGQSLSHVFQGFACQLSEASFVQFPLPFRRASAVFFRKCFFDDFTRTEPSNPLFTDFFFFLFRSTQLQMKHIIFVNRFLSSTKGGQLRATTVHYSYLLSKSIYIHLNCNFRNTKRTWTSTPCPKITFSTFSRGKNLLSDRIFSLNLVFFCFFSLVFLFYLFILSSPFFARYSLFIFSPVQFALNYIFTRQKNRIEYDNSQRSSTNILILNNFCAHS